jgi:tRNA 2-thiocytidine biosynthesis protein TtcA
MKPSVFQKATRLVGKAIGDFGLINQGDRILVALSGGKDSWTLLHALMSLRRKAPVEFELAAATVDPGTPGFDLGPLKRRLDEDRFPYWVIGGNVVQIVNENLSAGTNPCSFCSRLRRGILYSFAANNGWNKIALGHHLDDFVETLLMNMFFNGAIKGMSPHLVSDDGRNRVIRPLIYVREDMTRQCAQTLGLPILGCSCNYAGLSGSRRFWVKSLLERLEKDIPGAKSNLLASLGRVHMRNLIQRARNDRGLPDIS